MKVYISCDIEGISGVVSSEQTHMGNKEYERARKLMTEEANAATEGALVGGATEIVVNDAHGKGRNILVERLNPQAQLISGWPRPWGMMQGIDGTFDAAFFIGYHAQAGTKDSVIAHTVSGRIYQVRLNGEPIGETGLNAALAGYFGVPVVLVTGDRLLVEEAKVLLGPSLETVIVKEGYGTRAAKCLSPQRAQQLIREAAERALEGGGEPFRVSPPLILTVDFARGVQSEMAELIPGVVRLEGRRVEYTHDDYLTVYRVFRAMNSLVAQ
ncbi:MAG: M55 family metallopeptidase [Anaerolineae bacterium]